MSAIAAFRSALGLISIFYIIDYLLNSQQFSELSWLGKDESAQRFNWSLFFWFTEVHLVQLIFAAGLLASAGLIFQIWPRLSAILLFSILSSAFSRNPFSMDADDALLRLFIFYVIFIPSSKIENRWTSLVTTLLQIQITMIYFLSGLGKLSSSDWMNGSALEKSLLHPAYARFDYSAALNVWTSGLLAGGTIFVVVWELSWPLFSWSRFRKYIIIFGLIFHSISFLLLDLRLFPILMICSYFAFRQRQLNSPLLAEKLSYLKLKRSNHLGQLSPQSGPNVKTQASSS